jgi:hypothetical protein
MRLLATALRSVAGELSRAQVAFADGTGTNKDEITRVTTSDNQLSAVVTLSTSANSRLTRTVRALGIAEDCIVDVEVPVSDPTATVSDMESPAAQLVKIMLAKIAVSRR